jgi:hypothetical protein
MGPTANKRKPRISFSKRELDVIIAMVCIAEAGAWSEGDYESWSEQDYAAMETLATKVAELRRRKDKDA